MTQRVSDEVVEMRKQYSDDRLDQYVAIDLLSLRTAVRRVLHRKRIADDAFVHDFAESYHDLTVALGALSAEMAILDNEGVV